jgi:hypothetical protein
VLKRLFLPPIFVLMIFVLMACSDNRFCEPGSFDCYDLERKPDLVLEAQYLTPYQLELGPNASGTVQLKLKYVGSIKPLPEASKLPYTLSARQESAAFANTNVQLDSSFNRETLVLEGEAVGLTVSARNVDNDANLTVKVRAYRRDVGYTDVSVAVRVVNQKPIQR